MPTQPQIVSIVDPATGAEAKILVSLGFNCFSWRPVLEEGPREMLWAHADFASGNERPSGSGIPLLFPFPGRIGQAKYSFGGRDYQLEPGDAFGNAIHGFVHKRPWRVLEHAPARVVGEFQASIDDPSILDCWPSDFRIRVIYEVRGRELFSDIRFENTAIRPCPAASARIRISAYHLPREPRSRRRWSTRRSRKSGSSRICSRLAGCSRSPRNGSQRRSDRGAELRHVVRRPRRGSRRLVPHLDPRAEERPHRDAALRPPVHTVHRLHSAAPRGDLPGTIHLPARFIPAHGRRA